MTCGQFARQWPTPSVTIWNDIASARTEAAPRTSKNANASRRRIAVACPIRILLQLRRDLNASGARGEGDLRHGAAARGGASGGR